MGKDWFNVERLTALSSLKPGAAIHVIGVSGVAMAQMAVALSEKGFLVTGSDKEFYEPMGSFLKNSSVKLVRGYDAKNVPYNCDLVLIGNAVSYGHPEVDVVEKRNLPYTIFPKLLFDLAISGKHSVVVSGTHGKTTTSAMIAAAFQHLNAHPSYFVGGSIPGFTSGLMIGSGAVSVVEGDEYDSSFFAKVPKFSFYRPKSLIINAVEFDHADIYPDLATIDREFEKLAMSVPSNGTIYMCVDGAHERELAKAWRPRLSARLITFGIGQDLDVTVSATTVDSFQLVKVNSKFIPSFHLEFKLQPPGLHNAKNAAVAALVISELGFANDQISKVMELFGGVKRRQEVRFSNEHVTLIDDFAHHPTAVRETLAAIKQRYPHRKIVAVFEPRSNTSRRKVFQKDYIDAFRGADEVYMCLPAARSGDDNQLLDVNELSREIATDGNIPTHALADAAAIYEALTKCDFEESVILVMSNGGFGGLVQQLADFFMKSSRP